MPYEVFLAFRYLKSRSKRRLARVTAVMAILGIAMGVAALIVALALANGFRDEMRDKILQGTAHLSVLRRDGRAIEDHGTLAARLRAIDGVVSATATTYDGALVSGSKGVSYAVLRGLENQGGQMNQPGNWLTEGSFGPLFESAHATANSLPQAVVGTELATKLGVGVGDTLDVLPFDGLASKTTRRMRVAGIFRSGLYEYDMTWIYVSFETAASFAGVDHAGSTMSVQVSDPDDVKQVAANVLNTLGHDFTTVDWQQANQPLFNALALERRMGLFIIGLIVAIAALNITTMLILVVVERRRDIAILSTLGATRTGVMLLFVIEGATVGAIGAIAGVLIGLAACVIGNHYKLVSLPSDVYSISNVPLNARLSETLLAALIAFALSVLATIYPARNAARMRPVEVLRDA
jgi:lipoprotein-releasing system permease protein